MSRTSGNQSSQQQFNRRNPSKYRNNQRLNSSSNISKYGTNAISKNNNNNNSNNYYSFQDTYEQCRAAVSRLCRRRYHSISEKIAVSRDNANEYNSLVKKKKECVQRSQSVKSVGSNPSENVMYETTETLSKVLQYFDDSENQDFESQSCISTIYSEANPSNQNQDSRQLEVEQYIEKEARRYREAKLYTDIEAEIIEVVGIIERIGTKSNDWRHSIVHYTQAERANIIYASAFELDALNNAKNRKNLPPKQSNDSRQNSSQPSKQPFFRKRFQNSLRRKKKGKTSKEHETTENIRPLSSLSNKSSRKRQSTMKMIFKRKNSSSTMKKNLKENVARSIQESVGVKEDKSTATPSSSPPPPTTTTKKTRPLYFTSQNSTFHNNSKHDRIDLTSDEKAQAKAIDDILSSYQNNLSKKRAIPRKSDAPRNKRINTSIPSYDDQYLIHEKSPDDATFSHRNKQMKKKLISRKHKSTGAERNKENIDPAIGDNATAVNNDFSTSKTLGKSATKTIENTTDHIQEKQQHCGKESSDKINMIQLLRLSQELLDSTLITSGQYENLNAIFTDMDPAETNCAITVPNKQEILERPATVAKIPLLVSEKPTSTMKDSSFVFEESIGSTKSSTTACEDKIVSKGLSFMPKESSIKSLTMVNQQEIVSEKLPFASDELSAISEESLVLSPSSMKSSLNQEISDQVADAISDSINIPIPVHVSSVENSEVGAIIPSVDHSNNEGFVDVPDVTIRESNQKIEFLTNDKHLNGRRACKTGSEKEKLENSIDLTQKSSSYEEVMKKSENMEIQHKVILATPDVSQMIQPVKKTEDIEDEEICLQQTSQQKDLSYPCQILSQTGVQIGVLLTPSTSFGQDDNVDNHNTISIVVTDEDHNQTYLHKSHTNVESIDIKPAIEANKANKATVEPKDEIVNANNYTNHENTTIYNETKKTKLTDNTVNTDGEKYFCQNIDVDDADISNSDSTQSVEENIIDSISFMNDGNDNPNNGMEPDESFEGQDKENRLPPIVDTSPKKNVEKSPFYKRVFSFRESTSKLNETNNNKPLAQQKNHINCHLNSSDVEKQRKLSMPSKIQQISKRIMSGMTLLPGISNYDVRQLNADENNAVAVTTMMKRSKSADHNVGISKPSYCVIDLNTSIVNDDDIFGSDDDTWNRSDEDSKNEINKREMDLSSLIEFAAVLKVSDHEHIKEQ